MSGMRERRKEVESANGNQKFARKGQMLKSSHSRRFFTLRKCFTLLTLLVAALVMFRLVFGHYPFAHHHHAVQLSDDLSSFLGFQKHEYAVMFDAGSTGSRILVFTFHQVYSDGSFKLKKELFKEIKPGLSSYADNPTKGAESLVPLLELAKAEIPKEDWNRTPIVLKATAGLRLLPEVKAEAILSEVRKVFSKSPFLVTDDSVSIMDGTDEGLFCWFTVNFLLDTLTEDDFNMMASLDLGGGSTQITLVASDATVSAAAPVDVHNVVVFNRSIKIYVHSYLGLGLMAARLEILKAGNATQNKGSHEFFSPCVHSIVTKQWMYANTQYTVKGKVVPEIPPVPGASASKNNRVLRFEQCYKLATSIIDGHVYAPPELQRQTVYALSYYFDRATENGLIDPVIGGEVTVKDFFDVGKTACKHPNTEQPFACLDLAYISALLNKGFGLHEDKKIMLRKKVDGHELSWGLGAAFHVLANKEKSLN